MQTVGFVMIGGFLGSGKTTALLRLAQRYVTDGRRVGIIANDLGDGLVDTQTYMAHGLPVEEMSGVCFACRFDELIAAAGRLQDGHRPDVLLAEPAGSCTDLVSRVIEPLRALYADRFQVAPYVTLLDPQRAREALAGTGRSGFSVKVTYLYKMQQNEADVVAINKSDTLTPEQQEELTMLVARNFPKAEVMVVSARTGEGFDRLAVVLDGAELAGRNSIGSGGFDYELSARGDAALGWVSVTVQLETAGTFDADRVLLDLASSVRETLAKVNAEPAHVKMILQSSEAVAIANVTGSSSPAELSRRCGKRLKEAKLTINARVEATAGVIREQIETALSQIAQKHQLAATVVAMREKAPDTAGATQCYLQDRTNGESRDR